MRFAVEVTGTLRDTASVLDRAGLEAVFDRVAEALVELHDLETDVGLNLETAELQFYIQVEGADSRAALAIADELMDRALAAAEVQMEWNESHARRADLVPA